MSQKSDVVSFTDFEVDQISAYANAMGISINAAVSELITSSAKKRGSDLIPVPPFLRSQTVLH